MAENRQSRASDGQVSLGKAGALWKKQKNAFAAVLAQQHLYFPTSYLRTMTFKGKAPDHRKIKSRHPIHLWKVAFPD